MTKDVVKKGFQLAQQELEDKQVEKVKTIVRDTLSRIKDLEDQIRELEEEKKILKLDIDDLKDGHLDRIEERQSKDKKAKKVSIVVVEKEVHHHHDNWYSIPYRITYVPYSPPIPFPNPVYGSNTTTTTITPLSMGNFIGYSSSSNTGTACNATFTLTGSVTKNNTAGAYDLGTKIVHLR